MGFTIGWMYYYMFAITVLLEITAAVLVIDYRDTPVNIASWFMLMTVIIVFLNCFPVYVLGETKFCFALIKIIGTIGLLLMTLVITGPGGRGRGTKA